MAARKCSACQNAWPLHHEKCPLCDKQTWRSEGIDPMPKEDYDDALALKRYKDGHTAPAEAQVAEFERDWAEAERIAAEYGRDVADLIVAKWHPA